MNILGDVYIHISQGARSDHISKRKDFKVLEGRGRKTGGQQSHFWAYTPRKPDLTETHAPQCSSQHCLS